MKTLRELNAYFLGAGGPGILHRDPVTGNLTQAPARDGVGIEFDCPCGCDSPIYLPFRNPIDGGAAYDEGGKYPSWQRSGETLEDLTLEPSVQRTAGCRWHGYIRNGRAEAC